MRHAAVPISEILSLVNCAEDYGYADDVLFDAFAGWFGRTVTDEEIEAYAADFLTPENRAKGYSEEDYEASMERLTRWRDQFCKRAAPGAPTPGGEHP